MNELTYQARQVDEMELDRRRGARLNGAFWVWVVGADDGPRLRQGNISITGAFFVTDVDYGEPGTVRRVRLGRVRDDFEKDRAVEVLARVVRGEVTATISADEALRGVAFEFLIDERGGRDSLEALARAAVRSQLIATHDLDVSCHLPATVYDVGLELRGATVRRLRTESVEFWSDEALSVARAVRIAVRSPCSLDETPIDAVISSCVPELDGGGATRFSVQGRLGGESSKSMRNALALLGEAMVPSEACQPLPIPHLNGNLGEINLYSLLGFLEMERRSGVLRVESSRNFGFLYLENGNILDVEAANAGESPRERLATILDWDMGRFSLTIQDIDRKDRFGETTMSLLMDIARERDEASTSTDDDELEGFDEWTI